MKKTTHKLKKDTELFFRKNETSIPFKALPEEKQKKNLKLLLHPEAINQLLCFMRQDYIKAGQDILKTYGQDGLQNKFYNSIITIDRNPNTNPLLMFSRQEKKYNRAIEKLRSEIEQLIPLAGGRNVRPLINSLIEELTSIKAMLISTGNMTELNKYLKVGIDPRNVSSDLDTMIRKYGIILLKTGQSVENIMDAANNVDPLLLKPYSEFMHDQHFKLVKLYHDMLKRLEENKEQAIGDIVWNPLPEMFVDKELLIKICDKLVDRKYAEKVKEKEYRWKGKITELAAFSFWLSEHKHKLFVDIKDFDDGNHRGRALRNFFDKSIHPDKENKDSYQQFQDAKKESSKLIGDFNFLNTVI